MKPVLGQINGEYLQDILEVAGDETETVWAAVAYATDDRLFKWAYERSIPVKFWGRWDAGYCVKPEIAQWFINRRNANYQCYFLTHYHPKVIWWRGYGVYLGSANLTDAAWFGNVEAGVFLTEDEIDDQDIRGTLEQFFSKIREHEFPVSAEIVNELERRRKRDSANKKQAEDDNRDFAKKGHTRGWSGLVHAGARNNSAERRRKDFVTEWNQTLETLRMIAERVSVDEYRPNWVPRETSSGVQADQFLHAHYYQRTFDGRRANFESWFDDNHADPERALTEALEWWAKLPSAPQNEDEFITAWAPFLQEHLSEDRVLELDESQLEQVFSRVHAIIDRARRVPNVSVNLPDGRAYSIPEKITAMTRVVWNTRTSAGRTPLEVIHHVLYGGAGDEIPGRLWDAIHDPKWKIPHLGISAFGELAGWALPERFPPRNGRTSKSLRSLGFDVRILDGAAGSKPASEVLRP